MPAAAQSFTFGPAGVYTASWDGVSTLTVTLTTGGAFVASFAGQNLAQIQALPEFQQLAAQSLAPVPSANAPVGQLGPADHGLIAWNFPPYAVRSSDSTPLATAGKISAFKLLIPSACTITNIVYNIVTAGATLTANQCFLGLYSAAKGLLALTADQSTNFLSTGNITAPLTTPQAVPAGYVYVVAWFNGTTGPALARGGSGAIDNVGESAAASSWATADSGITTAASAPTTLAAFTALTANYWAAVS